eukprot:m.271635 g.271635  ORF g.271635 m.271635 type:complete len:52 (-) comp15683_c13_seq3:643-798(-)
MVLSLGQSAVTRSCTDAATEWMHIMAKASDTRAMKSMVLVVVLVVAVDQVA